MDLEFVQQLVRWNDTKIVMLVVDGLGTEPSGPTELEAADTPHLDSLAAEVIEASGPTQANLLALAAALAFGLGGREVAGEQLREWLEEVQSKGS